MLSMKANHHIDRLKRQRVLAGEWRPAKGADPEAAVFQRSFDVAEAARNLERVAGGAGSEGATAASLSCVTSAFASLADAMLKMRADVVSGRGKDPDGGEEREQLGRLLFAISQNLRFAAEASDLGRQAAEGSELARPRPAEPVHS